MSRRPGQRDVLYEGGPALKELIETYANTNKGIQRPVLPKPEPETPPAPAYEPPKDMIPPSLLKQVRGRRLRAWKEPSSRAELNTMPVPYPFSEIADAPYNRGLDETPEETGRVIRHTKNR